MVKTILELFLINTMSLSNAESRFFWMALLLKSPPLQTCQSLIIISG
ncbi:hypothetical protein HanXRQr2_Chr05g0194071 [Helianthus annuus]|uniref:Uncharacterized protein n=1 Tax=Helianthus annuus TaxID=4232 RepID=A0A9K3NKQ2_HELAN|nr:hypothetical protein HanXRQr2_Chr05g0194071 [Helianthus annuus]